MQYRGQEFQYDADNSEIDIETGQKQTSGKEYRRKRSAQATRRRAKTPASRPGCGIGSRRNNRWTW